MGRIGNYTSFKKFMMYIVEQGLTIADQNLYQEHCRRTEELNARRAKSKAKTSRKKDPAATPGTESAATVGSNNGPMEGLLFPVTPAAPPSLPPAPPARDNNSVITESDPLASSDSASAPSSAVASVPSEQPAAPEELPDIAITHGQICILYDRRGIEDKHIDAQLYAVCNSLFADMQYYYGDRLGMLYVLHVNWVFWMLYQYVVRPFLDITSKSMIKVFNSREELVGEHFALEEVHLLDYVESVGGEGGSTVSAIDPTSNTGLMLTTLQANANAASQAKQESTVAADSSAQSIDRQT